MLLFEVGDLIQKCGTGEVGIVVEHVDAGEFSYSSLGIPQAYEKMMKVRSPMRPNRIPAYKVTTGDGTWIWEHRETRLLRPKPPVEPEDCP
tara:strand:- start:29 stop:301 length:273 start_codon:yes stop_codon:yes gene_type:complete